MKPFCYRLLATFLTGWWLAGCQLPSETTATLVDANTLYNPQQHLEELFHDVQMARIFPDSKTFVDCDPLRPATDILADYRQQKLQDDFDLQAFVDENFRRPAARGAGYTPDTTQSFYQILTEKWDYLTRTPDEQEYGTLIPLPHKYVVPGGRFGEIYYWDSYFTMLGLQVSGRQDLIGNMLDNFAYLIDTVGFIPNGNRTYFLSRSQPPFFAAMVNLLAESRGDSSVIKYLPALEKEYAFWMRGADTTQQANQRVVKLGETDILNRYFDNEPAPRPESYREDVELAAGLTDAQKVVLFTNVRAACESGWDFSTRWFAVAGDFKSIVTTEILPVDLNSLIYNLEQTISRLNRFAGNEARAEEFSMKAEARKALILKYFWDEDQGFFVDYHWPSNTRRSYITPAGMYPFYFGIGTDEQAATAEATVRRVLLKPGGVATTNIISGQQWDAPNGWAPLQWMTIQGFRRYGNDRIADYISEKWLDLNQRVFNQTGKMMEKYNVLDLSLEAGGGEYPTQDGFGWSNGVALRLMHEQNISNRK